MTLDINGGACKWKSNSVGINYNLGFVGIGSDAPTQPLEIYSNSAAYMCGMRVFASSVAGANLRMFKARGTITAPLRARANDVITGYNAFPYYAANDVDIASVNATQANAQFQFRCMEAATATQRGCGFRLNLTPVGSTTNQAEIDVYNDGVDCHINFPNIPRAAGAAPAGLVAGDIWADTAAGNVLKVV